MREAADPAHIRVLYVDDDQALVRLIQRTLMRRGFQVVHAPSAESAFAALGTQQFDVVALDHQLADGTGLEFLTQLTGQGDTPAVVYVTGSSETSIAVAALKAGAVDFVAKTVSDDFLELLASALEEAVEKSRLRAAKETAERDARAARDRAEALLAEVNHRVSNSLALVASIVSLQAKAIESQAAKGILNETRARIQAIASVHQRLYSSGDVRFVAMDEYLSGLLAELNTSLRADGHGGSLKFVVPPLRLRTDAAISLGIVVTEWVTNAFKYAYPNGSGEIRVTLRSTDAGRVELSVEDDGVGRSTDSAAQGSGVGTRLVSAMASGMNAEIDYRRLEPGTCARLAFLPLPA